MRFVGDIALDAEVRAIASGAITDGAPVVVNADGTVSGVLSDPDSLGSATDLYDGGFSFPAVVYDTGQDKFLLVYTDDSNSYYGTGVVGTVSGSSVSFGTPVVFSSATSYYISASFDSNAGKTGIFWADYDDSERGKACVATISGTSVSYGSTVTFNSTASSSGLKDSTFDSSQNKIVVVYRKDASNGEVVAATISGTDISFGTAANLYGTQNGSFNKVGITYDSNAGKSLVVFHNPANSNRFDSKVVSLSGSTVSLGSLVNILDGSVAVAETAYDSTNNKVIVAYRQDDTESDVFSRLVVGTISGTSVSYGTAVSLGRGFQTGDPGNSLHYDVSAQKVIFVGGDIQDSYKGKYVKATVSGTSISIDSITTFSTRSIRFANFYDPDAQKSVLIYNDHASASSDPVARTLTVGAGDNITSENYIGIANAAYADGQKATVKTTGSIARNVPQVPAAAAVGTKVEFVAADLSNTAPAVFDPDTNKVIIAFTDEGNSSYGTVVVATIDSSDNSVTYGSKVVFNSAQTTSNVMVYDTNSDRIVIGYATNFSSLTGTAIVGTVSGSSVSFGSAVGFNGSTHKLGATFDSNSNKVVFGYEDGGNSGHGTAIVGTVDPSDNSISFGSEAVYKAADTSNVGLCFDTNSNKVVIVYRHNADSNKGEAIVGTVSGTSISYGSATVFNASNTQQFERAVVFDSSNNKVVIVYHDDGASNNLEAQVGTVSGTSISFGTLATLPDSADGSQATAIFDSDNNNIIISYQDDGEHGNVVIGTVSGTDISFNTPVEFESGDYVGPKGIAYDTNTKRALITFQDYAASGHGQGIVFSPAGTEDLTIGQQYFVQTDGTLGTSADDPSVIAGTAIGASDIIVKG
jgi:hypothetical protein